MLDAFVFVNVDNLLNRPIDQWFLHNVKKVLEHFNDERKLFFEMGHNRFVILLPVSI